MKGGPRTLAIDQGTTSTRALVFGPDGRPEGVAQEELPQSFPASGLVEHDPGRIWEDTVAVCREVLARAGLEGGDVASIGIANQRETTVLWERASGDPVHPAIVWQDRRTAGLCRELREAGHEPLVRQRTGLLLDPYFAGTKLAWLLEHVDGAREAAERGELAFGTVDSWLLWKLTGGRAHATDATNASRTLLFDIHRQRWDPDLLELFGIPAELLPEVRDSSGHFGETDPDLLGASVPVTGIAGDQQAATFGQTAFGTGQGKLTCGTGAFLLLNTGSDAVPSEEGLLTTVAWRLDGEPTYAMEGSIFSAGSAVQWLRDELGIVESASDTERLAAAARERSGVYLVPAFTGLGAPHWDPDARAALLGLTRDAGRHEVVRAALESVAYQTLDLVDAMAAESGIRLETLRVDGGFSRNDWAMQFMSDLLDLPVERPEVTETTALGAAYLAGLAVGSFGSLDELREAWSLERRWEPSMREEEREARVQGWRRALDRVLTGAAGRK